MTEVGIPKRLGHIWIGPYSPPYDWMQTWKDHHPDWEYTLYDNEYLRNKNFKTRKQINEYLKRGKYSGVADLMRYEILLENGGFIAPADSICYHCTEELFIEKCAYTVYENEFLRGRLVSPIYACEPKNALVEEVVDRLSKLDPMRMDDPWKSTGNLFLAKLIREKNPDIIIFPSHYFIPVHFEGEVYSGNDKIYAKQMFGSTRAIYSKNLFEKIGNIKQYCVRKFYKIYYKKFRKKTNMFDTDF